MPGQRSRDVRNDFDVEPGDTGAFVGPDGRKHERPEGFGGHADLHALAQANGLHLVRRDRSYQFDRVDQQAAAGKQQHRRQHPRQSPGRLS